MSALSTKTNAGFGELFYADTAAGSIFNGLTVNQIAAYADSVFSGADSSARILSADLTKLYNTLYTINHVFCRKIRYGFLVSIQSETEIIQTPDGSQSAGSVSQDEQRCCFLG